MEPRPPVDAAVFVSTFALIFLAEIGDKSQLMTIALASRHRALPVIIGTFSAFALLNVLAVAFGGALSRLIPESLLLTGAGLLFVFFAWQFWREDSEESDDSAKQRGRFGAVAASFSLIFVAELGDKTQLAMIALASRSDAAGTVLAAGTAAEWTLALIGVFLGRAFLRAVPLKQVHRGAALLFGLFGFLALAEVARDLMP
jgi:putative Ca2+/H+ antiporter (TMEM165/GDT1 family)